MRYAENLNTKNGGNKFYWTIFNWISSSSNFNSKPYMLRRMNIVDSRRRVNDKYTELNILELQNEGLIPFSHLFPQTENLDLNKEIENYKRTNMLFNHINVLEGIFVEMKYKTM